MLCAARRRIHKTAGPPLAGVAVACADDDTAPEAVTCDEVRRHVAARSCYAWLVREIVFKHVTALGHVVPAPATPNVAASSWAGSIVVAGPTPL